MLYPEQDAPLLKAWIVKRLENTSDADIDVLADYVLALLGHEGSAQEVREICEKEIPDFLQEDATGFLDDVFATLAYKSYLPGAPPAPKAVPPPSNPAPIPPTGPRYPAALSSSAPASTAQSTSRKRSYQDRGESDSRGGPGDRGGYGGRTVKQPRRHGYGGASSAFNGAPPGTYQASHVFPPTAPAGMPPAETGNSLEYDPMSLMPPMDSLMAGFPAPQAGGFPPGVPRFPAAGSVQRPGQKRCRDYDAQGFCTRGNTCPYEHGPAAGYNTAAAAAPGQFDGYDPTNATLLLPGNHGPASLAMQLPVFPSFPGAGDGGLRQVSADNRRIKGFKKNRFRSQLSADGPVHDRSKSTIVVENIPEEKFSEEAVRGFFSQFGTIVSVSMQPYKRLALVKFSKWASANAAYKSPKVIFDNRFVRVFWYKEDDATLPPSVPLNGSHGGGGPEANGEANGLASESNGGQSAEPEFDMDEIIRKQAEAQKMYEEKKRKKEEVERQRQELELRQKELLARQQAEREKLKAKLAAAGESAKCDSSPEIVYSKLPGESSKSDMGRTGALRAQLAALEEEARSMGLNPNELEESPAWGPPPFRGRGRGYRGRGRGAFGGPYGGYPPRGGFRGGFRGRGGNHAAYAAYSLDHRPRRVAVSGVDFSDSEKDEKLRHYLLGVGEFKDIRYEEGVAQITFNDRRTAETFYNGIAGSGGKGIPGVDGPLEVSWLQNSGASGGSLSVDTTAATAKGSNGGKSPMSGIVSGRAAGEGQGADDDNIVLDNAKEAASPRDNSHANMDYDVADDQEDWGGIA